MGATDSTHTSHYRTTQPNDMTIERRNEPNRIRVTERPLVRGSGSECLGLPERYPRAALDKARQPPTIVRRGLGYLCEVRLEAGKGKNPTPKPASTPLQRDAATLRHFRVISQVNLCSNDDSMALPLKRRSYCFPVFRFLLHLSNLRSGLLPRRGPLCVYRFAALLRYPH